MKSKRLYLFSFILLMSFSLFGCEKLDLVKDLTQKKLVLSSYANDIGFTLDEPTRGQFEVQGSFTLSGGVERVSKMDFPHLWIVAEHEDSSEEAFNYYIGIEDGAFVEEIILPYGAGNYQISIRAPHLDDTYYDVANFRVTNEGDRLERLAQYTRYGLMNGFKIEDVSVDAGSVQLTASLSETYDEDKVLIEVEKDGDREQIVAQVIQHRIDAKIPLYFGEGLHDIHIQLHNPEDDYYYTGGIVRVHNDVEQSFTDMEAYSDYFTSGIILEQPTWSEARVIDEQTYLIKGRLDEEAAVHGPVEHIIVTMNYLDEDLESGYIIPIENNQFEDEVYFRFGPGTYEININIPDHEQTDRSMFYYRTIAQTVHEVIDIPDERDALPSRGIESENPRIKQKAEDIIAGLTTERDQAKAIYEYVAKHVSYDVKKAEADLFSVSDSALSTLESRSGVCQDYAFLATALLRAVGIEAHYVSGYAGGRHAWVEAKVDGEWIEMDPTWGAGYVHDGQFYFQYKEEYFDPDPVSFQQTHRREQIMY